MLHISCIIILKCTFSFYCASYLFLRRKIFNLLLRKITFDFCSAIWIRKSVNDFHVTIPSLSLMISLVVKQSNVNILFLEFWLNLEKNMCFHYIFFISCAWIFHDDHFVFFFTFHVHFSWSHQGIFILATLTAIPFCWKNWNVDYICRSFWKLNFPAKPKSKPKPQLN